MSCRVIHVVTIGVSALCACVDTEEASFGEAEQALQQINGSQLNGSQLNGSQLNGMSLFGFLFTGATKDSVGLTDLRVDKGELVAERNAVTLRGADFEGVQLQAEARNPSTSATAIVTYRIIDVDPEYATYDPLSTGGTYLYKIEQWDTTANAWVTACPADFNGHSVAIPLAAEWDHTGARTDAGSMFTLACTSGAIAKCYRWGYRPWVTGYGDLATMHWTCTRLARADYCGNGVSYTVDGTLINVWDNLPPPGPVQGYGSAGATFDSAWNTGGATCLSSNRWASSGASISAQCPARLPAPGQGGTACNSEAAALTLDPTAGMFRELY